MTEKKSPKEKSTPPSEDVVRKTDRRHADDDMNRV